MTMYFAQNIWYICLAMFLGGLSNSGAHITVGKLIAIVIRSILNDHNKLKESTYLKHVTRL